ncbi:MAG TPA: GDP-mannose 4,6-dehydratase, partial [Cyanobacteria bacterium UBA8530]|nr:GDP-mannose 4,6-dehydratase [Cyanobacteria bacterium UBA8530]
DDFVIATGKSVCLERFIELAFAAFGLDWTAHTESRSELFRPTDLAESFAAPGKAAEKLGWRARFGVDDVVRFMADDII